MGQATFNILQVLSFAQSGGFGLCSAHDAAPYGKKLLMFQTYVVLLNAKNHLLRKVSYPRQTNVPINVC
jgi:hypothetical protein